MDDPFDLIPVLDLEPKVAWGLFAGNVAALAVAVITLAFMGVI